MTKEIQEAIEAERKRQLLGDERLSFVDGATFVYGLAEKKIERLREALEKIVNNIKDRGYMSHANTVENIKSIATEALKLNNL